MLWLHKLALTIGYLIFTFNICTGQGSTTIDQISTPFYLRSDYNSSCYLSFGPGATDKNNVLSAGEYDVFWDCQDGGNLFKYNMDGQRKLRSISKPFDLVPNFAAEIQYNYIVDEGWGVYADQYNAIINYQNTEGSQEFYFNTAGTELWNNGHNTGFSECILKMSFGTCTIYEKYTDSQQIITVRGCEGKFDCNGSIGSAAKFIIIPETTPAPTPAPTHQPTPAPTNNPTKNPSITPTGNPTIKPSNNPTITPVNNPTITSNNPSTMPTIRPTLMQTENPTNDGGDGEIVETTTVVTKHPQDDIVNTKKNNNDVFWTIIISLLVIVICCVCCLVFMVRYRLKKEVKKQVMNHKATVVSLHSNKRKSSKDITGSLQGGSQDGIHTTHSSNPLSTDIIIEDNEDETLGGIQTLTNPIQINNILPLVIKHDIGRPVPSVSITSRVSDDGSNVFHKRQNKELIEVQKWLSSFHMEIYYNHFISNGYDSMDIIGEILLKTELDEIGIKLKGHQTKLMSEIKKLKQDDVFEGDDNTDEGTGTNEDLTDPPTEEGDIPNDDINGSSDINNDMELLNEKSTKNDFGQGNVMVNALLMDDCIEDVNGNETPQ